jgi:hypothetical protein
MNDEKTAVVEEDVLAEAASALGTALEERLAAMSETARKRLLGKVRFAGSVETGRTLQVTVDFDESTPKRTSYLRLGAVPPSHRADLARYVEHALDPDKEPLPPPGPPQRGEDLALRVLGFNDDVTRRHADGWDPAIDPDGPSQGPIGWAHDYNTPSERIARSKMLHTLGGWREHTDGNRISTTRGDKVEVVGGNYKLVVLCRDPLGLSQTGWDVSGGHISGDTSTRGARLHRFERRHGEQGPEPARPDESISWESRQHGAWHSTETAYRGDSHTLQYGDATDRTFGHVQTSITGSETPTPWHEPEDCTHEPGACRANPVVVNRTWADRIASYTGSESWPIPKIRNDTFAEKLDSETYAEELTSHTFAEHLTSKTRAGALVDATLCGAMESNVDVTDAMTDETVCGKTKSTITGTTFDLTASALMVSFTAGRDETHLWGGSLQATVGRQVGLTVGANRSTSLGVNVSITIGKSHSKTVGVSVTNNLASKIDAATLAQDRKSLSTRYKALLIRLG